jgi:hypothetical protein
MFNPCSDEIADLEDANMVACVASDHIRRYGGVDTIPYLRAREREALQEGDFLSAEAWNDIATAAALILRAN